MIIEMNKQRVTSDYVELYVLKTPWGGELYFTTYHEAVWMRDRASPYANKQYFSLPIEFTGWEQRSEGAYARPRVTIANVLTTFSDALGDYDNDDLIGLQITRRKTLKKHLDNSSGDAHGAPAKPKEYPVQTFVIDRIESQNALSITFELASPFDVAGVTIPNRTILPNTCPWAYQGAATDTPFSTPIGACTWKLAADNNGVVAFFDNRNSLFADGGVHDIVASSAVAANDFFRTAKTLHRNNLDGTVTDVSTYDYWQAAAPGTTPFRRVRLYTDYDPDIVTYYTYKEGDLYNDVVKFNNTLWVCTKTHPPGTQEPFIGSRYWKRADSCAKKLSSCACRFRSLAVTNATGPTVSTKEDPTKVLKYGAFPASRRYNFTG